MNYTVLKLGNTVALDGERVACIGYFDGLHLGHQALIKETINQAKLYQCKSALITFSPDPWIVIKKIDKVEHLTPLDKRVALAKEWGIDEVIVIDFTEDVSHLNPKEFIQSILKPCNLKGLVCGFDFHYGFKGEGNVETLKEDAKGSFSVKVIDSINQENEKISTTRIVDLIKNGEISEANRLLGHTYHVDGIVIKGNQKGRTIGFPTANILLEKDFLIPKPGVYSGHIKLDDETYLAMINIGHNPTFNLVQDLSVEAHILNFHGNIYEKQISLYFTKFLREEQKFESLDELIKQLEIDRNAVLM